MLDVAVIGCGIVGANVAYLLSQHKLRAAVFEKENDVSMGTTRANSAIVHAGYDPDERAVRCVRRQIPPDRQPGAGFFR